MCCGPTSNNPSTPCKYCVKSIKHAHKACFPRLLKEMPAQCDDCLWITGSDMFSWNVFNTLWLEYVSVVEWLLEMWPHVRNCRCSKKGDIPLLHTKAFGVVSEAVTNPLFTVCLKYFTSVAKVITPFLIQYQTDRPMLPFLASDLHHMINHLFYWFMKCEIIDRTSSTSLSELILSDTVVTKKTSGICCTIKWIDRVIGLLI